MPDATLIASYQATLRGLFSPQPAGKIFDLAASRRFCIVRVQLFDNPAAESNGDTARHQTAYAMRWRQPPARHITDTGNQLQRRISRYQPWAITLYNHPTLPVFCINCAMS